MSGQPLLLLDACCAINLLASGIAEEIVESLAFDVAVSALVVEREVLRVRGPDAETVRTLLPLVEHGHLRILEPEDDSELGTFVDLALHLDDGEAMTAALAIHQKGVIATDDAKAIRVITEVAPNLGILGTCELLYRWANRRAASDRRIAAALSNIQVFGSFRPPRIDPLREWWIEHVDP